MSVRINDTQEELCFAQFSTRMAAWLFLLHMFTQSIEFYTFYYYLLKSTGVWKI